MTRGDTNVKNLRDSEAAAQSYMERCAELLDCSGYLIELSTEKIMRSRQVSGFARFETILTSRQRIERTKALVMQPSRRSIIHNPF